MLAPESAEPLGTLASLCRPARQCCDSLYQPLATQQPRSPHRKGTPPSGRKEGHLLGWSAFLLAHTAHLPAHTKHSFSNQLPRFELFNKAFCFDLVFFFFFPLSSTAKIPDPAVAKIKDFLLVFSLSSVPVDWEGPRDGLLFPCQMQRGYLSSGGAYTGIRHYSALC